MSAPKSAVKLAQEHPDQFLAEQVFQELFVDEFRFGPGTSGNLGANMISRNVIVPAHTKEGGLEPVSKGNDLAIQLNCFVTPSTLQNKVIMIRVERFHITARSLVTQKKVDAHGPSSIITADNSIHMNVNTGWEQVENLTDLAQEVGVNDDQTLRKELGRKQGYNGAYKTFRAKVELRINEYLGGNVVINWSGDATFPV